MTINTKEGLTLFGRTYSSCLGRGPYSHFLNEESAYNTVLNESEKIGVTRIADVTGFDRVGIPVYNSIKPTITGSSVQHGKGLTRTASKISALMESFERFHSVNPELDVFEGTYDQVASEMVVVPFERFLHIKGSLLTRDMPIMWTKGWDIANNVETAAPLAMVELAGKKSQDQTFKTGHIQVSSNGLSAGFHIMEAILQGLCEVIERDGITCHTFKSGGLNLPVPEKLIDFETIPYSIVRELEGIFRQAGVSPFLYDCSTDVGIPVYNCFLCDDLYPEYMCVHGMGAGLYPKEAMIRALTESAQSRVVFNAGNRDLLYQEDYETTRITSSASVFSVAKDQKKYGFEPFGVDDEQNDLVVQIQHCVRELVSVGLDQVIVFPLVPENNAIQVVRVLVPGAEGYIVSSYTPGVRALDYLKGNKK